MKILLVNGSPRKNKETFASLEIIRKILNENGVETTYFHLGNQPYRGCLHCDQCAKTSYCFNNEDECNLLIDLIKECDGVIIGTPVYFAGPNGALCALLDRVFYAASNYGYHFKGKLASGVATCWRAGATSCLDRLYKYFTFSGMTIVSSEYWNMKFDHQDPYGEEILKNLAYAFIDELKLRGLKS